MFSVYKEFFRCILTLWVSFMHMANVSSTHYVPNISLNSGDIDMNQMTPYPDVVDGVITYMTASGRKVL